VLNTLLVSSSTLAGDFHRLHLHESKPLAYYKHSKLQKLSLAQERAIDVHFNGGEVKNVANQHHRAAFNKHTFLYRRTRPMLMDAVQAANSSERTSPEDGSNGRTKVQVGALLKFKFLQYFHTLYTA
jgi:hypothetical protein